mmetsp:Transcript_84208/g.234886  ORF Transcript_84208/g.234886 Transcript_84208/m.234886 type:complete len:424 (+) Transcript_84208:771-2042(+)
MQHEVCCGLRRKGRGRDFVKGLVHFFQSAVTDFRQTLRLGRGEESCRAVVTVLTSTGRRLRLLEHPEDNTRDDIPVGLADPSEPQAIPEYDGVVAHGGHVFGEGFRPEAILSFEHPVYRIALPIHLSEASLEIPPADAPEVRQDLLHVQPFSEPRRHHEAPPAFCFVAELKVMSQPRPAATVLARIGLQQSVGIKSAESACIGKVPQPFGRLSAHPCVQDVKDLLTDGRQLLHLSAELGAVKPTGVRNLSWSPRRVEQGGDSHNRLSGRWLRGPVRNALEQLAEAIPNFREPVGASLRHDALLPNFAFSEDVKCEQLLPEATIRILQVFGDAVDGLKVPREVVPRRQRRLQKLARGTARSHAAAHAAVVEPQQRGHRVAHRAALTVAGDPVVLHYGRRAHLLEELTSFPKCSNHLRPGAFFHE